MITRLPLSASRRFLFSGAVLQRLPQPSGKYTANNAPPPPDYSEPAAWMPSPSVLPDNCHTSREPAADCFFVHPTSYFGPEWNAAYDDIGAAARTESIFLSIQASAFATSCRIFAPRYRQMGYGAFASYDVDSARFAADVAYSDVARAFRQFLDQRNDNRPYFLAAHSQGSGHLLRLLLDTLDGSDAAQRCVGCYALGMNIPLQCAEAFTSLRPSTTATQPHALVSYMLRSQPSEDDRHRYLRLGRGPGLWTVTGWTDATGPTLNTSPITWESHHLRDTRDRADDNARACEATADGQGGSGYLGCLVPIYEPPYHPDTVFDYTAPFPARLAKLRRHPARKLTATTTDYEVVVGGLPQKLADADLGQGQHDLHVLDYTCFWYNIRENVAQRLASYQGIAA